MTRVSVVTLTWNHLDYTRKAVESIIPILRPDDEIIVVDNNSNDGTQGYLMSQNFPCSNHLIFLEEQCGIGKAYNIAFRKAGGDFIFIYDNDLEIVMPNTLEHMIGIFNNDDSIGIVCPCINRIIGRIRACESKDKLPNDIQEIRMGYKKWWPECPSAAWLIRKECREKVGFWDEDFDPYGMADYDFARRVILAGYRILCDRFIFVQHYGSITASSYVNANLLKITREKFYKKWAGDLFIPRGSFPRAPRL